MCRSTIVNWVHARIPSFQKQWEILCNMVEQCGEHVAKCAKDPNLRVDIAEEKSLRPESWNLSPPEQIDGYWKPVMDAWVKSTGKIESSELAKKVKLPWREFAEWVEPRLLEEGALSCIRPQQYNHFFHGFHTKILNGKQLQHLYPYWLDRGQFIFVIIAKQIFEYLSGGSQPKVNSINNYCCKVVRERLGTPLGECIVDIYGLTMSLMAKSRKLKNQAKRRHKYRLQCRKLSERCRELIGQRNQLDQAIQELIAKRRKQLVRSRRHKYLLALRWSRWMLRCPEQHERAFWAQLQSRLKLSLPSLQHFSQTIQEGSPLKICEICQLTKYLELGTYRLDIVGESEQIDIKGTLVPHFKEASGLVDQRQRALLLPIAYRLSLLLQNSQKWPRYIIKCRNPYCRERFYSGRADAKTCPSPDRKQIGRRSECKAVWEAYQKWLKKIGRDPRRDWYEDELKEGFKAQYNPRGK